MKIIPALLFFLHAPFFLYGAPPLPGANFSLQPLQIFFPGNSLGDIRQKYGAGTPYTLDIHRFQIPYQGHRFPLFVQFKDRRSVGFWAALPTYFLHDIFHQKLIDQYGKQDRYLKKENSAVFVWNRSSKLTVIYSGQCTITCFPHYLFIFDPILSTLPEYFSTLPPTDRQSNGQGDIQRGRP